MSTQSEEIKKYFKNDIKDHQMTVIHDDGVDRHLVFSRPDTGIDMFEIKTWKGYLCFYGDRGDYIFRRLDDMFLFFRHDDINPSYWGEKLQSISTYGGYEKFSIDRFREAVKEDFHTWEFETQGDQSAAWEEVREKVYNQDNDGDGWVAINAARDFKSTEHKNVFGYDFAERGCPEYTHAFIWCLYALIYAIKTYDKAKESTL